MTKIDLKKELKEFYKPSSKKTQFVELPSFQFLMIDGFDARPESKDFKDAISALFSISYKIKFDSKLNKQKDYVVMPLEGLWWAEDMDAFVKGQKEDWKWTLMIMQPDHILPEDLESAIEKVGNKVEKEALEKLRLGKYQEGNSCQMLHIGPFSEEPRTISQIHSMITENNGHFDGKKHKHHEIYLSDFRKVDPEKMRTIIRQPFFKAKV